jgi:acyl-CoA thioesterase
MIVNRFEGFHISMAEIENRGLDDDFFNFLCKACESAPVHRTLDVSLTYLGQGAAGLKMNPGLEFSTIRGRLHGGIIATLADTAMGWAFITLGRACITIDMYTNYTATCFAENELIAEAKVIHLGRRTGVAEAALFNGQGELAAVSRGTFSVQKDVMEEFEKGI